MLVSKVDVHGRFDVSCVSTFLSIFLFYFADLLKNIGGVTFVHRAVIDDVTAFVKGKKKQRICGH